MRPVGILGGMGPEATILLMQRIMAAVPARDDSDHVPLIVHQNPQVPSRIAALIEGTGTDPGPVLAGMARGSGGSGGRRAGDALQHRASLCARPSAMRRPCHFWTW